MRPWNIGSLFMPRKAALEVIPGNPAIRAISREADTPGSLPGVLTSTSLALIDVR
jgi:hypothetical protein